MPWKLEEDGSLSVASGNPVWVYESGAEKDKEAIVDFGKTLNTISVLTRESIDRKTKLNELKAIVGPLEAAGITDVADYLSKATSALETVANLSDKEILEVGQVDKIKASISEGFTKQIEAIKTAGLKATGELTDRLSAKDVSIKNLVIKGAFDSSEYLSEKTVLLPDMAYSFFGSRFDVKDVNGTLTGFARDKEGNELMSIQRPGEIASPAEAIEIFVSEHPQRDRLLKMDSSGGGGQKPGSTTPGGTLLAQYTAAKAKGDGVSMVALKGQMTAAGLPTPL